MNTVKKISKEEELRRNSELKEEDLQRLRDWCAKQPHLPKNIDDSYLILFLHSNYYRLEPTKTTIENYYTCRTHIPELFSDRDPIDSKEIQMIMSTLLVIPMEQKTEEGFCVIYSRLINFDPERFIYNDCLRLYNMISDLCFIQSGTMKGYILICDITGVQMAHALRISPISVKKFLYYLQEAMPLRIKALHFMNTTAVMDFILGLMKPFMKKELIDMLHIHPTLESIKKHLPLNVLPNETGGTAGPMMDLYAKVLKNVENNRDFFIEEEQCMRVDELMRVGKANSAIDLFGIDGSFKKLDID